MKIPFCKVECVGNEHSYVVEVLKSGWLTTAGKCFEFEKRFLEEVQGKYAVAVNSATAALHLAVEALGVGEGDEVIVPSLTFTASAEVVRYVGADPVFVDVEFGSALLTPEILREAIKKHPRAKAVMVVHFGGQPARMKEIVELCHGHGLKVIEDAAHAFPAKVDGQMIGSWGDVTCFSFYANKTITTGEGGMLVTNDEAIAKRAKVMRLHGIDRDIWNRFTSTKPSWEYDVVAPGFKYNLPDLAAAVGLGQLEKAHELHLQRAAVAARYLSELQGLPGVDLPLVHGDHKDHAWHLFWLVLGPTAKMERNQFIQHLMDNGVGFSVHYKPLHHMTYYKERYKLRPEDFPNSERHWQGCVSLPLYPSMNKEEVDYVIQVVKAALS